MFSIYTITIIERIRTFLNSHFLMPKFCCQCRHISLFSKGISYASWPKTMLFSLRPKFVFGIPPSYFECPSNRLGDRSIPGPSCWPLAAQCTSGDNLLCLNVSSLQCQAYLSLLKLLCSFTQQIFTHHILCLKFSARCWKYSEEGKDTISSLAEML